MANLNKVSLMGRLTRDPELRYTPKGTAVGDISLAINRYSKDDGGEKTEETTFVDVTLWGKTAELSEKYLAKGREVYIEGRLQLDSWTDKESGNKRTKLKVVGDSVQFIGSKPQEDAPQKQQTHKAKNPAPNPNGELDEEDDIPF